MPGTDHARACALSACSRRLSGGRQQACLEHAPGAAVPVETGGGLGIVVAGAEHGHDLDLLMASPAGTSTPRTAAGLERTETIRELLWSPPPRPTNAGGQLAQ